MADLTWGSSWPTPCAGTGRREAACPEVALAVCKLTAQGLGEGRTAIRELRGQPSSGQLSTGVWSLEGWGGAAPARSWTGAKGVAPPLPHRGRSGRWAARRGSHGLFRGAGPVAPGLLPRQVRAACRNAAGLTHQRLLPTCRRPIKRSLPSPPPAPTAACPADSPPPSRLQPSGRAEPSAGRARVRAEVGAALDPDPAGAGDTGRRAGGQSRVARPHPSRPSRSPSCRGSVPILGPQLLREVNAHPSLGRGWLLFPSSSPS